MAKPLSADKRSKIRQAIVDHHLAFTVEVLGDDAIPREDFDRLVRKGVLKQGTVEHAQVAMQAAHTVGRMSAIAMSDDKLSRLKPAEFWQFIETAPPQFNQTELDAMNAAREHVGLHIKNLGIGLAHDFEVATHEEAAKLRHAALATVQHETALGIARDSSNASIMRRMKNRITDAERDWALVVVTELHNAKEFGKALALARSTRDPLVFKRPRPDACRFCKMLFLKDGRPRIFKLSSLVKNGTNVDRKQKEWKPVVGAVHPACQCELYELPDGFKLDAQGKLVPSLKKSLPDDLTDDLRALIGHRCEA